MNLNNSTMASYYFNFEEEGYKIKCISDIYNSVDN